MATFFLPFGYPPMRRLLTGSPPKPAILLETSRVALTGLQQPGDFCQRPLQVRPLSGVCLSEISPE